MGAYVAYEARQSDIIDNVHSRTYVSKDIQLVRRHCISVLHEFICNGLLDVYWSHMPL